MHPDAIKRMDQEDISTNSGLDVAAWFCEVVGILGSAYFLMFFEGKPSEQLCGLLACLVADLIGAIYLAARIIEKRMARIANRQLEELKVQSDSLVALQQILELRKEDSQLTNSR